MSQKVFNVDENQHIRFNPLKGEWILVSPHRTLRPWAGQKETPAAEIVPKFDPSNPLCPGAVRGNGVVNPNYTSTYVFTNDFPALLEDGPEPEQSNDPLFQIAPAKGTCRVICYHPHSDMYITDFTVQEVIAVINEWINQLNELGKTYRWVQIFENRGEAMGCSNPHPHCQIWASNYLPNEPRIKDVNLREYYDKYKKPLLMDYVEKELNKKERIVYENEEWLIVVPFWALWPFETMVLPKKQVIRFSDLSENQKEKLAIAMQCLVAKYDNLFRCKFPYSMGWHGAPTGEDLNKCQDHWTFHGIYLPPLLRSATVKKFLVGYELLAQSQRDLSPEKAASTLRELSTTRFA